MSHQIEGPCLGVSALCEPVLRSLPDWFGIEEAVVHYAVEIDHLPTFLARDGDRFAGFLSVKQHNAYSAEIYVMAVRRDLPNRKAGDSRRWGRCWPALFDRQAFRLHNEHSEIPMTLDQFFARWEESRPLFDALRRAVEAVGAVDTRFTKSQIAFRRRRAFAWVWVPDRYLGGGHSPLVLSVALGRLDPSPRWKQIVEPAPGRFMHHLELHSADEIDDEVRAWVREAWASAA